MSIKGDPDKFDFTGAPMTPEDAAKLINTLQNELHEVEMHLNYVFGPDSTEQEARKAIKDLQHWCAKDKLWHSL